MHIDSKVVRPDITKCIRTLKQLLIKLGTKSVGIARDVDILSATEWKFLVEKVNKLFEKMTISVVFFKNALPIPPVHERFRLIQEFHCSAISGHKGVTKTYNRLAREYYWRNMQSDVRQFVRGCPDCQTQKLVRVKTRLPMLITDTPSHPFMKVSIDFVGPKAVTSAGNQYILTIQDNFSKYCVLVPVQQATSQEVVKALTEKLICYFGPPVTIISDQGAHFMNKLLEEFAIVFKINKFATTAYHPQSNGGIERMHHTLNEYLKLYLTENEDWDEKLPLAQHAYNVATHEGLGYSPHEVVFGRRARTPSSFPPREHLLTYDGYLAETTSSIAQLRILAAMNLAQSKYKSKFYYDRKGNVQHFREGEMVYLLKKPKGDKTEREYVGPCEIISINHKTHNVTLKKGNQTRTVHVDLIKHCFEQPQLHEKPTSPIPIDSEEIMKSV